MEWLQLSNIADIVSGYAIPSADMVEEGTPIIKITNIKEDGSLDLENTAKYNKPITPKLQKFILKDKDVVVCMTGATIGKVARILKADQEYIVNQRVCIIRAKDSRLQDFVYHTLTLPTFRKYVEVVGYGAAQPNISASSIGKYRIQSSNELPTQQKIASILSTYDTLIENNTKRIRLLEQMAENLYKEWFVRFRFPGYENVEMENGLPKGWKISRLADFGRIETGKTPSMEHAEYYGGDYLFIKTPDMHGSMFVYCTQDTLSEEGNKCQIKKLLPPDSIMVSCIGSGGVVAINAKPGHTNQQINSIILKNKEQLEWLYFTCVALKPTIELFGATGATMTNLSKGKFEKLKVIEPQARLVSNFHKVVAPIFKQIKLMLQQNEYLTRQRDLLLPRLMSGKLEVMA